MYILLGVIRVSKIIPFIYSRINQSNLCCFLEAYLRWSSLYFLSLCITGNKGMTVSKLHVIVYHVVQLHTQAAGDGCIASSLHEFCSIYNALRNFCIHGYLDCLDIPVCINLPRQYNTELNELLKIPFLIDILIID